MAWLHLAHDWFSNSRAFFYCHGKKSSPLYRGRYKGRSSVESMISWLISVSTNYRIYRLVNYIHGSSMSSSHVSIGIPEIDSLFQILAKIHLFEQCVSFVWSNSLPHTLQEPSAIWGNTSVISHKIYQTILSMFIGCLQELILNLIRISSRWSD